MNFLLQKNQSNISISKVIMVLQDSRKTFIDKNICNDIIPTQRNPETDEKEPCKRGSFSILQHFYKIYML